MARSKRVRAEKQSTPPRELDVTIEEIGARGDGFTHVEGALIYVPYSAPGDQLRIEAADGRGVIKEILKASGERVSPSCPHFGACGGCALQHVSPDFYQRWKASRLDEALDKAGVKPGSIAQPIMIAPATRRRATFSVRRDRDDVTLGFKARASHAPVGIEGCEVLHPLLQAKLPALKIFAGAAPYKWKAFRLAVTQFKNGLDIDFSGDNFKEPEGMALQDMADAARAVGAVRISINGVSLLQLEPPVIGFDGARVAPPPNGFLQASLEGEKALTKLAVEALAGAKNICDLFSGCGSFTFPLARNASVSAVDSDKGAIHALQAAAANAQRLGEKFKPIQAQARNLFTRPFQGDELRDFDGALFDPPRAGANEQASALAKSAIPIIVGVSCNPATFARDAKILSDGGYQLSHVTPVDQFVYTSHIELLGVFKRA